ncbi:MAG: hypothetical protein U0X75_23405 [Acidobacteriota bacterium]
MVPRQTTLTASHKTPAQLIIACVVRQYGGTQYRTSVSLAPGNLICLGTHEDEQSANELLHLFWEAQRKGQIKTAEDITLFLDLHHAETRLVSRTEADMSIAA